MSVPISLHEKHSTALRRCWVARKTPSILRKKHSASYRSWLSQKTNSFDEPGRDAARLDSNQTPETIEQSSTPRLPGKSSTPRLPVKSSTPTLPVKSSTPRLPANANFKAYGVAYNSFGNSAAGKHV